ncbi:hypothetical protein QWE_20418 [Agrobacterium albertimagni AOL15]|uniref:Uncharacterized protein n=1 Tax=Agrobacterium albertimagni AOL15 TaxID=1156935 RepID=K2Q1U2_9HYPH|nr:hypothetical protein [Agrobacterium albertimagni]EKF57689.1 hypothetical protein QWE_20418 [Agrobacterium albertimagni AOL15]
MKIYEIDRLLTRCFLFICFADVVLLIMLLKMDSPTDVLAGYSIILQLTTTVSTCALMASMYGVSTTTGAERVFSLVLCMMFFIMLNIETGSKFLGLGVVSIGALAIVAGLVALVARSDPEQTRICLLQLRDFALSRNSILFAAALLIYIIARTGEHGWYQVPDIFRSGWLPQASLLSVTVLFLYAACPYLKGHVGR